jgi:hypothetical protein
MAETTALNVNNMASYADVGATWAFNKYNNIEK